MADGGLFPGAIHDGVEQFALFEGEDFFLDGILGDKFIGDDGFILRYGVCGQWLAFTGGFPGVIEEDIVGLGKGQLVPAALRLRRNTAGSVKSRSLDAFGAPPTGVSPVMT